MSVKTLILNLRHVQGVPLAFKDLSLHDTAAACSSAGWRDFLRPRSFTSVALIKSRKEEKDVDLRRMCLASTFQTSRIISAIVTQYRH